MGILDTVPLVYLQVQGADAPSDLTRSILSLEIDEHVRKATKISLSLLDDTGAIRDGYLIREGDTVTVRWGYPGRLSRPRAGIVHKLHPEYASDTVTVEAYGRELALSPGPIRRQFRGRTFRAAVEELARDTNTLVTWEAGEGIVFDAQVIDNETVWAWIQRRTAELGLETEVIPGTGGADVLVVREPRLAAQAIRTLHYKWRNAEILSFETETHTRRRQRESEGIVAVFVDPASGTVLTHAAGDPNTTRATLAARRVEADARRLANQRTAQDAGQAEFVTAHPELADQTPEQQTAAYTAARTAPGASETATDDNPVMLVDMAGDSFREAFGHAPPTPGAPSTDNAATVPTVTAADRASAQQHIRQVAEGRFRHHERGKVRAKITTVGLPELARGRVVQVVGVDVRDAGLWYIHGCRHKIAESYTVELECKREGVNGPHGRRPAAAAQQNTTTGEGTAGQAERLVPVTLAGGAET